MAPGDAPLAARLTATWSFWLISRKIRNEIFLICIQIATSVWSMKKLIYLWPCRLFCKTSSSSSRCRCFVCDKHLMKLIVDRAWRGQFEENYARIIKTEAERNMFREASSTIGVRAPRIEFQSKGMFPISLRIVTIFSVTSRRAVWVRIFRISIYRRSQHQTILHLSGLGDKRSWESFSCREK